MKKSSALIWGFILIAIGSLLLVQNFVDIDVWGYIFKFWPMILVVIGAQKLYGYFMNRETEDD